MKQDRKSRGLLSRIPLGVWWLSGAVLVTPFAIWGIVAWEKPAQVDDAEASQLGKVFPLSRSGVAVSKDGLLRMVQSLRKRMPSAVAQLVSAGQVLTPSVGTHVRITYSELLGDMTIYQVEIQDGQYRGRSGWVMGRQIRFPFAAAPKIDQLNMYGADDEPLLFPGGGADGGVPADEPPDTGK
jgi:hypothetical protein